MLVAWYGHLKHGSEQKWYAAAMVSWLIASFEYLCQVPANRIGFNSKAFSLQQLKILQEILTLSLFAPFSIFFMKQALTKDFIYASLCLVGTTYFAFR